MTFTTARRFAVVLVGLAAAALGGSAGAATVRSASTDDMNHWYGRAGGLAGSDAVSKPKKAGQPLEVGMPANDGSLLFNDVQGIRATPNIRTTASPVQVGLPANDGSLFFNEAQGGIRSTPNMRPRDETDAGQPSVSGQLAPAPQEH